MSDIESRKMWLLSRINMSKDFTEIEKKCLIDLVNNDLANQWEATQYGMIPIKGRYENVPQDEKLLFYDEETDDFFVGEVNDITFCFNPAAIAEGYHGPLELSWCQGERFDAGNGKSFQHYYGMPTHFAYLNDRPKKYICNRCGHAVSVRQKYCDRCGMDFKLELEEDE